MNTIFLNLIFKKLPLLKNSVCFKSFYGLYNDNPKYISEELHKQHPDINIYWIIDSAKCNTQDIPNYVKIIPAHSIRKMIIQNICPVIVDNLAGWYSSVVKKNEYSSMSKCKNSKVYNISTWHGTPKKKIGVDAYKGDNLVYFTTSDVIIDNSKYNENIFYSCFQNRMPILIEGTPRNDILVNHNLFNRDKLLEKLQLPREKKIVLYAPTFRDVKFKGNNSDFMYGLNCNLLLTSLKDKFGGDWVLVFRGHQFDQGKQEFKDYLKGLNGIIDGNTHDDMAEYLAVTDVLITDYSGSMFDFVLTQRPCFLYTPDRNEYENSERGVYDVRLPFDYCENNYQLQKAIENYNDAKYQHEISDFRKQMGLKEDGDAAKKIVSLIMKNINKQ